MFCKCITVLVNLIDSALFVSHMNSFEAKIVLSFTSKNIHRPLPFALNCDTSITRSPIPISCAQGFSHTPPHMTDTTFLTHPVHKDSLIPLLTWPIRRFSPILCTRLLRCHIHARLYPKRWPASGVENALTCCNMHVHLFILLCGKWNTTVGSNRDVKL